MATPDLLEDADNVPHALPVHPAPVSAHVTPRFLESSRTVAVNFCVPTFACALALVGETLTVIRDCPLLSGAPGKAKSPRTSRATGAEILTRIRIG